MPTYPQLTPHAGPVYKQQASLTAADAVLPDAGTAAATDVWQLMDDPYGGTSWELVAQGPIGVPAVVTPPPDPYPNPTVRADVRAATTTNIALTGLQTVDGVALSAKDSVLVKNQTAAADNGVYVADAAAWKRRGDLATGVDLVGSQVAVLAGGQAGTQWVVTTPSPITLGTTAITWTSVGAVAAPYNIASPPSSIRAAVADGTPHPLSERFATLAAAQAVFPRAAALTELIDRHALQYAFDTADWAQIPTPPGAGSYIVDVRSVAVASLSSVGNVLTVSTTLPHGYTAADVAAGNVVVFEGLTTLASGQSVSYLNYGNAVAYPVASVPSSTTLTVVAAHADFALSNVVGTAALKLPAALFTRAADSGALYAGAGLSARGLGNQRIEVGSGTSIKLRPSANGGPVPSGTVFASGNLRTMVNHYASGSNETAATSPSCPNLDLDIVIDGNRSAASASGNHPAIYLVHCDNLRAVYIEAMNSAGRGFIHTGVSDAYTLHQWFGYLHLHDNAADGGQNSQRTRRVHYDYIDTHDNGQSLPGHGFYFDHSQSTIVDVFAEGNGQNGNVGHGLYIHNLFDCDVLNVTSRGNGGHGILVSGFVQSHGGKWSAQANSQASAGTYDDVHFDSAVPGGGSYGVSQASTVDSITAGFDVETFTQPTAWANKANYALYVEDGVGDIHLKGRLLGAGSGGTYRAPATTIVGQTGDVYSCVLETNVSSAVNVLASEQTVSNRSDEVTVLSSTLPSNVLRAGSAFRVVVAGSTDCKATSGTLTIRVYLGTVVLATVVGSSGSATTNQAYYLTTDIVVQGSGAAAACAIAGLCRHEMTGGANAQLTKGTVDTTAAETIKVTFQWATADPANIARADVVNLTQLAA